MHRWMITCIVSALAVSTAWAQSTSQPELQIVDWHGHDVVEGELLVQFEGAAPASAQMEIVEASGLVFLEGISEVVVRVSVGPERSLDEAIDAVELQPGVAFAQPNVIHRSFEVPNDTHWSKQWGARAIRAPEGWDLTHGSDATIVSIIDSGVRHTHNDLDDKYEYGYDYYSEDPNPNDTYGHGTHCAGIAASETNNSLGIAGVGWNSRFLAYRCGDGSFPSADLIQAINDSRAKGAHVISMSWGSSYRDRAIEGALNTAHNAGCVNVAAAGNNGDTARHYPAALNNVIGVASFNSNGNRSGFSTYGDWVSVAAPGSNIYSTWKNNDNNYTYLDGTSMACPQVAGLASLLYSATTGGRLEANADLVRQVIEDSSINVSWVEHGKVDVRAALEMIGVGPGDPPGDCVDPILYGQDTPGTGATAPVPSWANGWPSFGNQGFAVLANHSLPSTIGSVFIGFARESVDAGAFWLNVSLNGPPAAIILPVAYDGNGQVVLNIPIPNNPFIGGMQVNIQFTAHDPAAPNGIAASQGLEFFICDPNG